MEHWYSLPFLHSYLDDLLAPGIVLGLVLLFFQRVFPADEQFRLPALWGLYFVLWYALFFELIFPLYDARHYADPWDVVAYATGTLAFYRWGNRALA